MPPGNSGKAGQGADPEARRPVLMAVVRLRAGCIAGQWSARLSGKDGARPAMSDDFDRCFWKEELCVKLLDLWR